MRGLGGNLFNNKAIVATSKYGFANDYIVGLLLDMEECKLEFFINGKSVLCFSEPKWRGMRLYASASLITTGEEVFVNFNVSRNK